MNITADLFVSLCLADHPLTTCHEENIHIFLQKASGVTAPASEMLCASV